jgi:predicted XRE-type DNA-binding protein
MRIYAYNASMPISLQQIQLDSLIAQAGLNDRELGEVLGVNQSTAWRLRNGRIRRIEGHVHRLRAYVTARAQEAENGDASLIPDLVALAARVPALKDALIALRSIMHNYA